MKTTLAFASLIGFALGAIAPSSAAGEAEYPTRQIRLVVPFPPGGGSDTAARLVAGRWAARLGDTITIENRSGASGNIGMDAVAKAHPDGYTIGLNSLPLAVNPFVHRSMPFDTLKDLVPVGTIATTSLVLVVNPGVSANSVRELVDLVRARPGGVSFGATSIGVGVQLPPVLFKELSEPNVVRVPYRGDGPVLAELVGGHLDAALVTVPAALPHIRAGRLRALAVVGADRSALLPGVPTAAELEPRSVGSASWFVVVAPAGTPQSIIAKLNRTLDETLREPDLIDRMAQVGLDPWVSSPTEASAFMREEIDRCGRLIRERGLGTG